MAVLELELFDNNIEWTDKMINFINLIYKSCLGFSKIIYILIIFLNNGVSFINTFFFPSTSADIAIISISQLPHFFRY